VHTLEKNFMNFLPITGFEDSYAVSDTGVVKSIARYVLGRDGVYYPRPSRILSARPNKRLKYPQVSLWKDSKQYTKYVHRLVAIAWIPNPLNLPEVNHIDGDRLNNQVSNLEWCTRQGNAIHAVRTGLKTYTSRLTKEEFIQCLHDVLEGESYYSLSLRLPYRVPYLSTKIRKIAKEQGIEHLLDAELLRQKQERARVNGNPHIK